MAGSVAGILVCGMAGGLTAWLLVGLFGVQGIAGALVAAIIGMVVATGLWAGGSVLLRRLGWIR